MDVKKTVSRDILFPMLFPAHGAGHPTIEPMMEVF